MDFKLKRGYNLFKVASIVNMNTFEMDIVCDKSIDFNLIAFNCNICVSEKTKTVNKIWYNEIATKKNISIKFNCSSDIDIFLACHCPEKTTCVIDNISETLDENYIYKKISLSIIKLLNLIKYTPLGKNWSIQKLI